MTQQKLSRVLRGQSQGISEAKLLECLTRLNGRVQIVIGPASQTNDTNHIEVVFAA